MASAPIVGLIDEAEAKAEKPSELFLILEDLSGLISGSRDIRSSVTSSRSPISDGGHPVP